MDQLSIDLKKAPEVADLLSGKNAGDKVEILVAVTIAEKDGERFVADIDEVVEVDGETLAAEEAAETEEDGDEEEKPSGVIRFGKGKRRDEEEE